METTKHCYLTGIRKRYGTWEKTKCHPNLSNNFHTIQFLKSSGELSRQKTKAGQQGNERMFVFTATVHWPWAIYKAQPIRSRSSELHTVLFHLIKCLRHRSTPSVFLRAPLSLSGYIFNSTPPPHVTCLVFFICTSSSEAKHRPNRSYLHIHVT